MITESFDENKVAMINPRKKENVEKCDVIIATFSSLIVDYVVQKFKPVQVGEFRCVNGGYPVYIFEYAGKRFGFFYDVDWFSCFCWNVRGCCLLF